MRGQVSAKLNDFLVQVNQANEQAKTEQVTLTPQLVRENLNKLSALISQGPELPYVADKQLTTKQHRISVRIYSPAPSENLPVVMHFHGGGHMAGSIELYDPISRKIAQQGHCIVIAVDYRLSPEYCYPAGLNDCLESLLRYKELLSDITYGSQLYIAGDSAGGALCATLSANTLTHPEIKIDKQILIYPSLDYTMEQPSIAENGHGYLLEQEKIAWYFDNYFPENTNRRQASPLYMPTNAPLPKTLIFYAGCDPLRDEAKAYITLLKNSNTHITEQFFADMPHAYMLLESLVSEECQQTYQLIGEFIKS